MKAASVALGLTKKWSLLLALGGCCCVLGLSYISHVSGGWNPIYIPPSYKKVTFNSFVLPFLDKPKPNPAPNKSCHGSCDKNDIMCRPKNLDELNAAVTGPSARFKPFLVEGEYMFPWEKVYLSFPALADPKTLPDLNLSTVNMAAGSGGSVSCNVGQRLTGRLDVKDGYGRQRRYGLDEVRAWLVDTQHERRRAVAQVTDYRNGSYGLAVTCLWPQSVAQLRVAVSYPREYIRAAIRQVREGGARYTAGLFKSKTGEQEVTMCHPTPNIPGRQCICNYTSFNSREFYCGRPLNERLNCSDWAATFPLNFPLPYHVTASEAELIKGSPGPVSKRTLSSTILIHTSAKGRLPSIPKCHDVTPNVTWDMTSRPQGFWNPRGLWQSLVCQGTRFSHEQLLKCLRDSHLLVMGDSNANRMYNYLVAETGSRSTIPGSWPRRAVAQNRAWGITVEFTPHDYPLYLGQRWEPILRYGGVEKQLDALPSTGRHLVILHYFLHVTAFHLSVARSRVEAAAGAIRRLLERNPEAGVAFRGPHVASMEWDINHAVGGDSLGRQYLEIISKAFADLRDRVVFLDGWEMATALENEGFHPSNRVPFEMVPRFLSFLCKT